MFNFIKKNYSEIIICLIIVSYTIIFSYLSIYKYRALNSHYYDLGIMNQVVYNTSRGWFLEMTNQEFRRNVSRLAIHFDPILVLFAPFYRIYPQPDILLIGQSISIALAGLAVFLIANHLLKNKILSLIFFTSFLAYFPIQRSNIFDFHPVVLAVPFFLWAYYFILKKNSRLAILFIFLSLLTKEHVGLIVFLFGLYLIFFQKIKKLGLIVSIMGLTFFIFAFFIAIPFFRQQSHFALRYFSGLNDLRAITLRLLESDNINYFSRLIFPYIPYLIFSPVELLIGLPEAMINMLSNNSNMKSIYFHYNSLIVPFIIIAAINGAAKIRKHKLRWISFILFVTANFFSFYQYNPYPVKYVKRPLHISSLNKAKLLAISQWQRLLVDDRIKVATTPKLAPFFTSRRYYYNFLYDPGYVSAKIPEKEILTQIDKYSETEYVIINKEEIGDLNKNTLPVKFYINLIENKKFKKIFDEQEIEVFTKKI